MYTYYVVICPDNVSAFKLQLCLGYDHACVYHFEHEEHMQFHYSYNVSVNIMLFMLNCNTLYQSTQCQNLYKFKHTRRGGVW